MSRPLGHASMAVAMESRSATKFSTNPYSINRMTLAAGLATLKADDVCTANCRRVVDTREVTVDRLRQMGFEVLPSKANFVFARHPHSGGGFLYRQLKARGVLSLSRSHYATTHQNKRDYKSIYNPRAIRPTQDESQTKKKY